MFVVNSEKQVSADVVRAASSDAENSEKSGELSLSQDSHLKSGNLRSENATYNGNSEKNNLEERLKILRRDSSWKKRELRKHEAYVGPSKKRQLKSLEAAKYRKKYR